MDNTYEHEQYEQDRLTIDRLIAEYETERAHLLSELNSPSIRPLLHEIVKSQKERRVAWCAGALEALHRVID